MIDKIFKDPFVNPKVELSQKEYNELVTIAGMTAKMIEERARQIYENEGVLKINFSGRFYLKKFNDVESDKYEFTVNCAEYLITPSGMFEKPLYIIPLEGRKKIAREVKKFVEITFASYFGEHMLNLNEIERLKHKQKMLVNKFIIVTVVGWMLAVVMCIAIL